MAISGLFPLAVLPGFGYNECMVTHLPTNNTAACVNTACGLPAGSGENKATFFARLKSHLAPSEVNKVKSAYYIAKYGHRAQKRKGETGPDGMPLRYFEHPRRVAISLMDEAKVYDPDLICAALLHDAIEDCSEDFDADMVEHMFGPRVARIVVCLSKSDVVDHETYIRNLWDNNDISVVLIKALDRIDNLRSLGTCPKEFREKQWMETREKYLPLFEKRLHDSQYRNIADLAFVLVPLEFELDQDSGTGL